MHINPQPASAPAGDDPRDNRTAAHPASARSSITGRLVAMLRTVIASPIAEPTSDDKLMLLGCEWEAAVAAANRAEHEAAERERVSEDHPDDAAYDEAIAANDRVGEVFKAIMECPAATLPGLAVKAAAARREIELHYPGESEEPACIWARALIDSILTCSPGAPVETTRDRLAA